MNNSYYSGWKASPTMFPIFLKYIESDLPSQNRRIARALAMNHPGFLSDDRYFTLPEMDRDPFYQWVRKQGGGWSCNTVIQIPTGDAIVFCWERRFDLGPFAPSTVQRLDPLRPHLARAALIAGRLALEQAHAITEALARLRLPAGVINFSNRLIAANSLLQELVPDILQDRANRVTLTDRRADALLEQALMHLSRSARGGEVSSIPIVGTEGHPPSIIHVVPMRGAARDVFTASSCVLVLTPVSRSEVPSASIVRALFDLTPAEARTAVAIAEGQTLEDFAAQAGMSIYTARAHLRAIFAKIGVSRQADLVALLGMTLPK